MHYITLTSYVLTQSLVSAWLTIFNARRLQNRH